MSEKHIKKGSTSLTIKEIELKTTLRFQLVQVKITKTNNIGIDSCWRKCEAKGILLHCRQMYSHYGN